MAEIQRSRKTRPSDETRLRRMLRATNCMASSPGWRAISTNSDDGRPLSSRYAAPGLIVIVIVIFEFLLSIPARDHRHMLRMRCIVQSFVVDFG